MVLFKIQKKNVGIYMKDCALWAQEAAKHSGFLGYKTLVRTNEKGHYASFYMWRSEKNHARFMKIHHDRLVSLSHCPVKVMGYYNFKTDSSKI